MRFVFALGLVFVGALGFVFLGYICIYIAMWLYIYLSSIDGEAWAAPSLPVFVTT